MRWLRSPEPTCRRRDSACCAACLERSLSSSLALSSENARGRMIGETGALKLLYRREDMKLLGVHCVGEGATELVHIGLTAMLCSVGGAAMATSATRAAHSTEKNIRFMATLPCLSTCATSMRLLLHRQHRVVVDEPGGGRRDRGVADSNTGGQSTASDCGL